MANRGEARDRSRSPLRQESLSDMARAALDIVCKRDGEARIEDQRATIARLTQQLAEKDQIIAQKEKVIHTQNRKIAIRNHELDKLSGGRGVKMDEVWRTFSIYNPFVPVSEGFLTSQRSLISWLTSAQEKCHHMQADKRSLHGLEFQVPGLKVNWAEGGKSEVSSDEESEDEEIEDETCQCDYCRGEKMY